MISLRLSNSPRAGFTLLELLVVIAILAILFALVGVGVASGKCKAGIAQAQIAVKSCQTTIGLFSGPSIQDVLNCLKDAQAAIDELAKTDWYATGKPAISGVVRETNKLVDDLAREVNNSADKASLRGAKLDLP